MLLFSGFSKAFQGDILKTLLRHEMLRGGSLDSMVKTCAETSTRRCLSLLLHSTTITTLWFTIVIPASSEAMKQSITLTEFY